MKFDHMKFNHDFIGPLKAALTKLIGNAKAACRLTLTDNNPKELAVWVGRWRKAVMYLRIINAVMVFAKGRDNIAVVIERFEKRTSYGSDDSRDANQFAVTRLTEYKEKLEGAVINEPG